MTDTLLLALRIFVLMLVFYAAYSDVRYLRIRNEMAVAVALLFIPVIFLTSWHDAAPHLIAGAIVFAIGFFLYLAGLFGGGDVKLLGALALWLSFHHIPAFLLFMTFSGGILALLALGLKRSALLPKLAEKCGENSWFAALSRGQTVVPYGVAIAIAAALTLF
jgi:prepilin peptidase CpaA